MDLKELQESLKKLGVKMADGQGGEPGSGEPSSDGENGKGVSVNVEKLADSIADKIASAIVAKKGGSQADKESLKIKFFSPQSGIKAIEFPALSEIPNLSKNDKILTFFKALVMSKLPESQQVLRALVEGTDAEGGYLVPEEFRSEVWRILPDFTVMRRYARVLPMATDTLNLNSLTARPSAYWTAEYGAKTTTSAEFGRTVLQPNDLVCLIPVTHQLLADANINLVQFITELFAEALGLAEDKAFFTGSGTGQPKGINQETLTQVDAGLSVSFDHVIALIDSVPSRITRSPRAAFVGHKYTKRILRTIKDTNGNYIWRDGGSAANNNGETRRLPDTLYGYPFEEQNDLDSSELYFGDWAYYIIGDRQSMVVSTTTEGGEAWRRNSTEIKAVERVDGKTIIPGAFAKMVNLR